MEWLLKTGTPLAPDFLRKRGAVFWCLLLQESESKKIPVLVLKFVWYWQIEGWYCMAVTIGIMPSNCGSVPPHLWCRSITIQDRQVTQYTFNIIRQLYTYAGRGSDNFQFLPLLPAVRYVPDYGKTSQWLFGWIKLISIPMALQLRNQIIERTHPRCCFLDSN